MSEKSFEEKFQEEKKRFNEFLLTEEGFAIFGARRYDEYLIEQVQYACVYLGAEAEKVIGEKFRHAGFQTFGSEEGIRRMIQDIEEGEI